MSIELYDIAADQVIRSTVGIGKTSYQFALDNLCPLIDRLDIQRNPLSGKMYKKMQEDILKGAILPPITVAFVTENVELGIREVNSYINENIRTGFILDGIQRLSALKRINEEPQLFDDLNTDTPLYINVVLSPSKDTLLYRMITLNNGQKPMSPRHQIEALYDFTEQFDSDAIELHTEKSQRRARSKGFKKADVIKAYTAYLGRSYNVDNKKIIESKMDELLFTKIIDNKKEQDEQEFDDVLQLIDNLSQNEGAYKWFTTENNIIGFCSAIRSSYEILNTENPDDFENEVEKFETYFNEYLDRSKIKIGTERRKAVHNFIADYDTCRTLDVSDLNEYFLDKGYI